MINQKTICLNMIVKNEAHVLEKTLLCLVGYIKFDYYVICDTGSTDGTQQLIKDFFDKRGVQGEIHDREWKNFGFNRSEAFKLAEGKSDYVFVFDADDYIHGDVSFPNPLDKDFYLFKFGPSFIYYRPLLFKNNLNWSFKCVLHEYAHSPLSSSSDDILGDYFFVSGRSGDRNKNQKEKREKDIKVLEDALKEEPNNERYWFYLAQTYKDSERNKDAIKAYEKRINLGGWDQETFFAILQKAECYEALGDKEKSKNSYFESFIFRPSRIEGLYKIGKRLRIEEKFQEGYLFLSAAIKRKEATDSLFVDNSIYEWMALDELSICSFYCGFFQEAFDCSCEILDRRNFPEEQRERLEVNRIFAFDKVKEELIKYPKEKINSLKEVQA